MRLSDAPIVFSYLQQQQSHLVIPAQYCQVLQETTYSQSVTHKISQ
jgi:hypothetical protein